MFLSKTFLGQDYQLKRLTFLARAWVKKKDVSRILKLCRWVSPLLFYRRVSNIKKGSYHLLKWQVVLFWGIEGAGKLFNMPPVPIICIGFSAWKHLQNRNLYSALELCWMRVIVRAHLPTRGSLQIQGAFAEISHRLNV